MIWGNGPACKALAVLAVEQLDPELKPQSPHNPQKNQAPGLGCQHGVGKGCQDGSGKGCQDGLGKGLWRLSLINLSLVPGTHVLEKRTDLC